MNSRQDPTAQVRLGLSHRERVREAFTLEPAPCPLCDGSSGLLFSKNDYPIHNCLTCGHHFAIPANLRTHIEDVYADDYFKGAPTGYADYLADKKLLISHARQYARMLNRDMRPGTVLDVGAAAGFILKGFEELGWSVGGIEPNPSMADYARHHLGITVETGTLEETQPDCQYDLVAMIQVVAHFVDPRRAFEVASKLTKPGGYWLIETWNRESWTARVFGKRWHEYSPPSVLHWFSIDTLRELVQEYGLREIAHGRPTKRISVSHARSVAQGELGGSRFGKMIDRGMRILPERLLLPYMFDDIFWALYRKPEIEAVQ